MTDNPLIHYKNKDVQDTWKNSFDVWYISNFLHE